MTEPFLLDESPKKVSRWEGRNSHPEEQATYLSMAVHNAFHELGEVIPRRRHAHGSPRGNIVLQMPARAEFHDKEDARVRLKDLVHGDHALRA
jgi:hypothetical protein